MLRLWSLLLVVSSCVASDDLYCGDKDCYSILGLESDATKREIKKKYFKLSLEHHPDKNDGVDVNDRFKTIARAYEVLGAEDSRAQYDIVLANPEQYWQNHYKYYSFRMGVSSQTSVWKVIVGSLLVASVLHYLYWFYRHEKIQQMIRTHPRVKDRIIKKTRELNAQGKTILAQDVDISDIINVSGWLGRKPTWRDILVVQLVVRFPFLFYENIQFWGRYLVYFTILKRPYDQITRSYLTANAIRCSWSTWQKQPEEEREELIKRRLWKKRNYNIWVAEQMRQTKRKSGKNKYR